MLEIQVLQAPHIAEADDAAMTRIEEQMAASEAAARTAVQQLQTVLPPAAAPQLADAIAALDRFNALHEELIVLSRRNSDVRSLALTLGRKRTVTAECEDQLRGVAAGAREARVHRDALTNRRTCGRPEAPALRRSRDPR